MKSFKPPFVSTEKHYDITVFLAGSIDMGFAVEWQKMVEDALSHYDDVAIFNPRRDDWDATWVQDISNPNFTEQVEWELDHLERADIAVFYFDPAGPAPITLMELGLHASDSGKCVVACPPGYWRRGNVQIICKRFGIPMFNSVEELIGALHKILDK